MEIVIYDPTRAQHLRVIRDLPFQDFLIEVGAIKQSPNLQDDKPVELRDQLHPSPIQQRVAATLLSDANYGHLVSTVDIIRDAWDINFVFVPYLVKDRKERAVLRSYQNNLRSVVNGINNRWKIDLSNPRISGQGHTYNVGLEPHTFAAQNFLLLYRLYQAAGQPQNSQDLYKFVHGNPADVDAEMVSSYINVNVYHTKGHLKQAGAAIRIQRGTRGYYLENRPSMNDGLNT